MNNLIQLIITSLPAPYASLDLSGDMDPYDGGKCIQFSGGCRGGARGRPHPRQPLFFSKLKKSKGALKNRERGKNSFLSAAPPLPLSLDPTLQFYPSVKTRNGGPQTIIRSYHSLEICQNHDHLAPCRPSDYCSVTHFFGRTELVHSNDRLFRKLFHGPQ